MEDANVGSNDVMANRPLAALASLFRYTFADCNQ